MANDPSVISQPVQAMRNDWAVVDALLGGTTAMRAAGESFLPKWPKEENEAYKFRLKNSTLLPAFAETVNSNAGRVFANPVALDPATPARIVDLCDNIDNQGNNLTAWASWFFSHAISHGIAFALVEFPKTRNEKGEQIYKTLADELRAGVRPYVVSIQCKQVLGWSAEIIDGKPILTQFRYIETVDVQDSENVFASKTIEQVRVLERGGWAVYRKNKETGTWSEFDSGRTSLNYIPLAVLYTKRTGFMTAVPPLMELAHLNIKHWQSQSDQDNILHVARVPVLAKTGSADQYDEAGNRISWQMTIGTSQAVDLGADGDLKFVEHSGAAIESGRQSLLDLESQMQIAGAKLLQKDKQQTKTATQAAEEAAQELSPLESMADLLEDCIDQILQICADFIGEPSGGYCNVSGNFDVDYAAQENMQMLKQMTDSGYLSQQTFFSEAQRRGVVSQDVSWEDEKQRIADQGPAIGAL